MHSHHCVSSMTLTTSCAGQCRSVHGGCNTTTCKFKVGATTLCIRAWQRHTWRADRHGSHGMAVVSCPTEAGCGSRIELMASRVSPGAAKLRGQHSRDAPTSSMECSAGIGKSCGTMTVSSKQAICGTSRSHENKALITTHDESSSKLGRASEQDDKLSSDAHVSYLQSTSYMQLSRSSARK